MIAPYEAFPTRDAWVMIGAASDALFVRTCEALGLAELPADPRYAEPGACHAIARGSSTRWPP